MNTLHPVQDHFDIIEWGLYTDLSLFVQLNDPEVNKTTVLKDQAAFLQNLCAFDLKLNIVDNGAIIRRHLGFPWSQAPLGQSLGRCRAGGVGVGKLRQEAWTTHRASSTTRSSRFTVSDFFGHKFEGATTLLAQTISTLGFTRIM